MSQENNPRMDDTAENDQDALTDELQPYTAEETAGQGEAGADQTAPDGAALGTTHNTGEPAVEQAEGAQAPGSQRSAATDETASSQSQQPQAPEQAREQDSEQTQEQAADPAEDLFDLLGDEGKKYKKKKPEQNKGAAAKASEKEKKEPAVYKAGTEIAYAGHKMNLPSDMDEEQILKFLEDPFPELADKEQTEFRYDTERNRLVPTRKALKKGAGCGPAAGLTSSPAPPRKMEVLTRAPEEPLPPVHRRLGADGVYEVRATSLGVFTAKLAASERMSESVRLKLPKPPAGMLRRVVEIFKQNPDSEDLLTLVYDHTEDRHRLVRLEQQSSAVRVHYDALVEDDRFTTFCEIHSHHRMPPFFSTVDDSSEAVSGGLFGVIGYIEDEKPSAMFRYSCGGHFRSLRAGQLFETAQEVADIIRDGSR